MEYLAQLAQPANLAVMVAGTLGGLLLGAAPGLSPTMAVALLIPFTFYMPAETGLLMLGAVYSAAIAGGAISAILIKVPGAPANIATAFDGHPMACAGDAQRAIGLAFFSSLIGGVVGVLVLIFLAPPVAEIALGFGPPELFWMAILGVTIIATVGSRSMLKGLFAGGFGLWLSTIGYSPMAGEARFIVTQHLEGGVNTVAALIGMFSIPQVFVLAEKARSGTLVSATRGAGPSLGVMFAETVRHRLALVVGTVSGVIVGIVPGVGGQIASIVAYDQTRKLSRDRSRFGSGEPAGLIASESANNAMAGPSLVPMLTLGVPGSPTAAVLMGGLLINGLFPGPDLFTDHANVVWTFVYGLLACQFLLCIGGLWISRWAGLVLRIPNGAMAGAILVLAVFGTYGIQNSMSDVLVMLTLGVSMHLATKVGFEAAPVVLGLILGPLAESNFAQGWLIANATDGPIAYFTAGPVNLLLIGLCIASIAFAAVTTRARHESAATVDPAAKEARS